MANPLKDYLSLKNVMNAIKSENKNSCSIVIPDQGLLELLIANWSKEILSQKLTNHIGHLIIVGQQSRELKMLETVLSLNHLSGENSLHRLPGVHFWGNYRFVNQMNLKHQRIQSLAAIHNQKNSSIILSTMLGIGQMTLSPKELIELVIPLKKSMEMDLDELIEQLKDVGYHIAEMVTEVGSFAVRGGILDVFPAHLRHPIRLEFFGDQLESLRIFNADTQTSVSELEEIQIYPAIEAPTSEKNRRDHVQKLHDNLIEQNIDRHDRQGMIDSFQKGYSFNGFDLFSPLFRQGGRNYFLDHTSENDIVIYLQSRVSLIDQYQDAIDQFELQYQEDRQTNKPAMKIADHFLSPSELKNRISEDGIVIEIQGSQHEENIPIVSGRTQLDQIVRLKLNEQGKHDKFNEVSEIVNAGVYIVLVIVHEFEQAKRLQNLFAHHKIDVISHERYLTELIDKNLEIGKLHLAKGHLSEWIYLEQRFLLIIPDFIIFGNQAPRKARPQSSRQIQSLLSSFRDLSFGSPVVHVEHGIGRYLGIKTLEVAGIKNDFLIIEYAGQDKVYVPVDRLNLVQKYSGGEGQGQPPLDRLQSQGWIKRKNKIKKAIQDLADHLLRIQAERKLANRTSYSDPGDLYYQFEGDFPYDETEDQLRAIEEINNDFSLAEPMDRLVCGDVGFGKTEVALRAAMRVVLDGWQVMVLAPTTILSFQHFKTFKSRFDKYGVKIGLLNRFIKGNEVSKTKSDFQNGKIDILIGTHRILSKDILPKKLGLVVVDEEQRFGVTHKERIKSLRAGCDLLTLTATPIPRSLQMAMLGLRNISIISTPPVERLAIRTFIAPFESSLIQNAINHEIARGGQVFFVHNRVDDILNIKSFLSENLPDLDIRVAHGQMREHELERVMLDFIERRFSVLVCTTIIESGLDIPNVNTIIINQAENFGLAQLYQMRGRVGRSSRQSYAYFLTQSGNRLNPDAERRLEILAAHQELGSGFQIANYDLEMRGAGNLLGAEQSGHIAEVGLELYTDMLHAEIEKLRTNQGVQARSEVDVEIKINVSATISDSYISSESQRLNIYKSLFSAKELEDVERLSREVKDRFGPMPILCLRIFKIAELKLILRQLRVSLISVLRDRCYELKFHSLKEEEIALVAQIAQQYPEIYKVNPDFSLLIQLPSDTNPRDDQSEQLEQLIDKINLLGFHFMKVVK